MTFDPVLATIRFGTGLGPGALLPYDEDDLLADLLGPDRMRNLVPIPNFAQVRPTPGDIYEARQARRNGETQAERDSANALVDRHNQQIRDRYEANLLATLGRMATAPIGFRERMVRFWTDHFTLRSRAQHVRHTVTPAVEEAIRPHATGRFEDLLRSITLHPAMLLYLEQERSHGPNSPLGLQRRRGLNENLARELLELHTLGVGARYSQRDVRELAELLTGLTYHPVSGFAYDARLAEPGAENVLGVSYSEAASLDTITAALDDLARHPATVAHICRKLAVHFVAPGPPADMLAGMEAAFRESDGDIFAVMRALVTHPLAFHPDRRKIRRPMEFIAAGLKALDIPAAMLAGQDRRAIRHNFKQPLMVMGQTWERPPGPDGWPEETTAWITPQGMAGRITWGMKVPARLRRDLPDPRDFVHHALGPAPPPEVSFAADAASNRVEGIGIVLASPAFQRR